jgi:peptidyl-prolyl cis-trans isomerase A (cyclophilin A)
MRFIASIVTAVALFSPATLAFAQETPAPAPTAPAQTEKPAAPAAAVFEYAVMRTTKGDIVIELNRSKAPITVENFVTYVKQGFYDGTVFHRVMPTFVIQGGGFTPDGTQKKTNAPITNEWQNDLKNARGTLSMARLGRQPDSATSQFFVSLKDNVSLDQPNDGAAYAVFGKVIAGMDVVDAIALTPTGMRGRMANWPIDDVVMTKVEMLSKEDADKMAAAKNPAKNPAKPAPAAPAPGDAPTAPEAKPTAPATAPATTPNPAPR